MLLKINSVESCLKVQMKKRDRVRVRVRVGGQTRPLVQSIALQNTKQNTAHLESRCHITLR